MIEELKLKLDYTQQTVLIDRLSYYVKCVENMVQIKPKQIHYIHLSIVEKFLKKLRKKEIDQKKITLTLEIHTAIIIHSALMFSQENHPDLSAKQYRALKGIDQQLPYCRDKEINTIYTEN